MSELHIVPEAGDFTPDELERLHEDTSTQPERRLNDRPDSIPNFEGETVAATKAKITSVTGLEIGDRVLRMDESVKLVIEARVVGVHHLPNTRGDLERVHVLKAIDSQVINWEMDLDALREALA